MKKKGAMSRLLEKIEEYYERNEHLFLSSDKGTEEGGVGVGVADEEEKELEHLISSLDENGPARAVHMPGYPE